MLGPVLRTQQGRSRHRAGQQETSGERPLRPGAARSARPRRLMAGRSQAPPGLWALGPVPRQGLHPGPGSSHASNSASGGRGPGAGSSPPVSHVPLTRLPQTMRSGLSPRSTSQPGSLSEPLQLRFCAMDPGSSRAGHCHPPHGRPPVSPGAAALGQAGRQGPLCPDVHNVTLTTRSSKAENREQIFIVAARRRQQQPVVRAAQPCSRAGEAGARGTP